MKFSVDFYLFCFSRSAARLPVFPSKAQRSQSWCIQVQSPSAAREADSLGVRVLQSKSETHFLSKKEQNLPSKETDLCLLF